MSRDDDRPNTNKMIHPPVVALICLLLAVAIGQFAPFPNPFPAYLKFLGVGVILIGLALGFGAFDQFRKAQTTLDPHGSVKTIVSSGIFRFTRNPIYLGFFLMIVGFPLLVDSLWGVVVSPLFALTLNRLVIEKEETYLEQKFGEPYATYKSKTRRWL
ncbi:MAG: isoprenylcysteine carboxylmethyltransferase family protein [Anaerolineales bacterium]|nr:isoprenylcysteine carboxylmethyltransferase family protein [Anaerolineales bacterium]